MGLGKDKTFEHTEFGMPLKRPREDGKLLRTEKRVSFLEDVWALPVSRSRCGLAHCWRRGGVGERKRESARLCAYEGASPEELSVQRSRSQQGNGKSSSGESVSWGNRSVGCAHACESSSDGAEACG